MKLILPALCILVASCGETTETTEMTETQQPATEEWTNLFNGSNTNGWHIYGGKPVGTAWKVKDSVLSLDVTPGAGGKKYDGGNLVTDESFDNFHLKLEWKISPKGNSGILFFVEEDTVKYKQPYETGLEMQVLDNDGHPDGKIPKHRSGDLYDLIPCSTETVKPVGEWNQVEIICNQGKLELMLNNTVVVTTTLWDDAWKALVAGSKFKTMPGFGTYKKGKICLQDHDDEVSYRNIRIKRL